MNEQPPGSPAAALETAARRLADDPAGAQRLALEVLATRPQDARARLVLGAARRRLDDPEGAREILEPLALAQPQAVFARREAALALGSLSEQASRAGRLDEAEVLAARRLALEPASLAARLDHAAIRFRQGRIAEAKTEAERLVAEWPGESAPLPLLAACRLFVGDATGAVAIYEALLERESERGEVWLALGHALKTLGRLEAAEDAYRRCLRLASSSGEAWWSLANLKTARFGSDEEVAIDAALAAPGMSADERVWLLYASGKAKEDRGAWDEAFAAYSEGARLRRAEHSHDARAARRRVEEALKVFTAEFFDMRARGGEKDPAPIFIVGLPRSGSTLVEQILASHPHVEGVGELPYIVALARELDTRGGYFNAVAALTPGERTALGQDYLARAAAHRRSGKPRFVDKAPNNFHHLGLIRLILPRATIIDARRHPMACGFSAFKQLFASGHDWSYDLAETGAHIADYLRLMDHFDRVLPGLARRVIHEDLAVDFEPGVRAVLGDCGLDFDPACLTFWRTERPVASASAAQVRRPLSRHGLEHWRAFERRLRPLELALGDRLQTWRGATAS
ncbi:MAG TPA: sulfotransferase [Caulobacteraceae bacterium]|nr:sulfotransferase [Caulobacteraceae bacterium]